MVKKLKDRKSKKFKDHKERSTHDRRESAKEKKRARLGFTNYTIVRKGTELQVEKMVVVKASIRSKIETAGGLIFAIEDKADEAVTAINGDEDTVDGTFSTMRINNKQVYIPEA